MANSLVTDTDLTAVADAIRTKGGTSANLQFPDGFVDAIDSIETGGGDDNIEKLISNTLTSYEVQSSSIRAFAFRGASNLTTISFANEITFIGDQAFSNSGITALHGKFSVGLPAYLCQNSTSLVSFVNTYDGSAQKEISTYAFGGCTALEAIDLGTGGRIGGYAFTSSTKLKTLVIRGTGAVAALGSTNAFNGTPFASGGTGGNFYVPSALISSYQSATNWSTILGYANNQILPIEGSIYETQYADGTPIS